MEQTRESRELKKYSKSIFDKGSKNIQCGKIVYSINGIWNIGDMCKIMKLDHFLTKYTGINSK